MKQTAPPGDAQRDVSADSRRKAPYIYSALASALSLLGDTFLYTVLPVHFTSLGLSKAQVGVLLSINRFTRLATNRFAGGVCDAVGIARPFVLAMILGACTTGAYGLVRGFALLVAARVLWGLSWSFIRLGYLQTTTRHAPPSKLAEAMGLTNGICRLGSLAGAGLGGVLADVLGFAVTALSLAALSFLAVIPAMISQRPKPRTNQEGHYTPPAGQSRKHSRAQANSSDTAKQALQRYPRLWPLLIGAFTVALVGSGILISTLGRHLDELFGEQIALLGVPLGVATVTGLLLGARWIIEIGAAPVMGRVADRLGRHKITCVALAGGGAGLVCVSLATDFAWRVLAVLAFFVCGTTANATLNAEAALAVPAEQRNRFLSWFVTAWDLGSAMGPLLAWTAIGGISLGPLAVPAIPLKYVYVAGAVTYFATFVITAWPVASMTRPSTDRN